jgi:catecholate siderophore receptor
VPIDRRKSEERLISQGQRNGKIRLRLAGASLAVLSFSLSASQALAQDASASQSTVLPALEVQGENGGYAATTPGLQKLTEPLLDTPLSIDTISGDLMQDRAATTLNDALRNAPSITLEAGEFNWEGNAPYIRGFSARTDMYLDGMRDFGDYDRDPWNLEKVEVLEGPDSVLFGRGSTGGVINQVTKTPTLAAMTAASAGISTDGTERVTADEDLPIDGLGLPTALRVNLMGDSGGVAGRDVVHNTRYGFAPACRWGWAPIPAIPCPGSTSRKTISPITAFHGCWASPRRSRAMSITAIAAPIISGPTPISSPPR